MSRQTVIITGGNVGLGYRCAEFIARAGDWHIVLACRDPARGAEAVEQLRRQTGYERIETLPLDLASLASVRAFAGELARRDLPPLRALVCNAGIQVVSGRTFTRDGFELTFGVNHLGHFLLANLLLHKLQAPARILFVSSGTHDPARKTGMPVPAFDAIERMAYPAEASESSEDRGVVGRRAYTTSKLCNVLCAYEFERRLRAAGVSSDARPITVNAFDPGLMPGSGLARDYGAAARFGWNFILPVLGVFMPGVSSTKRSGRVLARLVLEPEFEKVSGRYFEPKGEARSSVDSYDLARARELWEGSTRLVGLGANETLLPVDALPAAEMRSA